MTFPTSKDRDRRIPVEWVTVAGQARMKIDGELVDHDEASILQHWGRTMRREGQSTQYIPLVSVLEALHHLQAKPNDAAGARQIFHDWVCASEHCGTGSDHAHRTQVMPVRILRRVLREVTAAVTTEDPVDGIVKWDDDPAHEYEPIS